MKIKSLDKTPIPIYTLQDIIEESSSELFDENIVVFEIDPTILEEIALNYPCKADFLGGILVTEGEAVIKIDFEQATLKPQDMVNIFLNNVVEFVALSKDCRMKGVLISASYMSELQFNVDSGEAMHLLSTPFSKIITLRDETYEAMLYHTMRLSALNVKDSNSLFLPELIKSHITILVYELAYSKEFSEGGYVFTSSRKEELAVRFIGLVGQEFRSHRDVQYYAEKLHISRKHLTRSIKEVYNLTPKEIIDQKIVGEAKVLLQKTELTISELMDELNFTDQAAFSKFFKNNTGLSPLSYRKNMLR